MSSTAHDTRTEKGISLARGPALLLGTILLIAGLYFLYKIHTFPKLSQFPSGTAHVDGKAFLGIFGVNGWSGELTAAAGGLLLFGAAQHLLAKTMSLIVGIVLGVMAVIALVNHHSALGLFAANIWTIILWGASAALLLINTLLPRRTARVEDPAATTERDGRAGAYAAPAPASEEPVRSGSGAAEPAAVRSDQGTDTSTPTRVAPPVRADRDDGPARDDEPA